MANGAEGRSDGATGLGTDRAGAAGSVRPELAEVAADVRANGERAERLRASATPEELTSRPARGGWSVVECVEHLNATARSSLTLVEEATAAAPRAREGERLEVGWLVGRLFLPGMEPPARLKFRATKEYVPPSALEPDAVFLEFARTREALLAQLVAVDGVALNRVRVRSPFVGMIRYSAFEWLRILVAHERRHLWQAEVALEDVRAGV